jgi:hypothetical protein
VTAFDVPAPAAVLGGLPFALVVQRLRQDEEDEQALAILKLNVPACGRDRSWPRG